MIQTLLLTCIYLTAISMMGYMIHRCLHQRWTGRLHVIHMAHHIKGLEDAGSFADKLLFTVPVMLVCLVVSFIALGFGASLSTIGSFIVAMFFYGIINDVLHYAFHAPPKYLRSFSSFERARRLHLVHHGDNGSNFGMMSFLCDATFGTFREAKRRRKQ